MPDFQIDKSSGVGSSVIKVNPSEPNKGSTPKMAQLKVIISDGTTKVINLTQNTAQQTYKYFLIVDPTQVPVDPLGGKVEVYVESYREIYLNGQLQGTEEVGYTIQGESGITVNGNTITVGANGTPLDIVRRATVIQDTSGKQVTITIQQTAGQSESSYVFTADPMFVEFDAAGGSQAITITSSKSTMVNGQPPTTVELDYTATISPGFTWDGTKIIATENTGTNKTGTLVLTQAESNQDIRIEIKQAAGITEYRFAIKLKSEPEELFRQSMNLNYSATDPETYPISVRTSKFVNGQGQLLGYTMRSDAAWIQVSSNNESFTIMANTSESSRSGTITLTQDESGNQCTINVFQQGVSVKEEYTFSILSPSASVENVGGTVTPSVTSQKIVRRGDQEDIEQVGYSWDMGSIPDWIRFDNLTEQFTIEENLDTTRGRTATLQATQEESSKRITLVITQAKAEYTFLLRHRDNESQTTDTLEFNFNWDTSEKDHDGWYYRSRLNQDHMIGFSAKSNVDWITLSNFPVEDNTSPQPPDNPTFHVANNNGTSARTGTVTLTQNHSGKTCKIIVHQTGAPSDTEYTFSGPATITVEPEGGSVAMNIQSQKVTTVGGTPGSPTPVSYSLTSNSGSSWVTPNVNTNRMEVKENTEQEERSATLKFRQAESGKTRSIGVTQKAAPATPAQFTWANGSTTKTISGKLDIQPDGNGIIDIPDQEIILLNEGGAKPTSQSLRYTLVPYYYEANARPLNSIRYEQSGDKQLLKIKLDVAYNKVFACQGGKIQIKISCIGGDNADKQIFINFTLAGYSLYYRLVVPEYILNLGNNDLVYPHRLWVGDGVRQAYNYTENTAQHPPFIPSLGVNTVLDDSAKLELPCGKEPGTAYQVSGGNCYNKVVEIFMYKYNEIEGIHGISNEDFKIYYQNTVKENEFRILTTTKFTLSGNWLNDYSHSTSNLGSPTNPKFTITVGNGIEWQKE